MEFIAIDFETANYAADSACALGLAVVKSGRVVQRRHWLVRPPSSYFRADFTALHGLDAAAVRGCPDFAQVWLEVLPLVQGQWLAAHNARFDRSVLQASLEYYGLPLPRCPFVCTLEVSRRVWQLPRHNLAAVARHLELPLQHHQAESDALVCAGILLAAAKTLACTDVAALLAKTNLSAMSWQGKTKSP